MSFYYFDKNTLSIVGGGDIPSVTDDQISIEESEYESLYISLLNTGNPSASIVLNSGETGLEISSPEPIFTTDDKILNFKSLVSGLIYDTAISYGYDSIDNAVSYYNSGITAWRNEAIAFNTWRDNTETLMFDNIFSFTADGITLPNLSGFTAQAGYFDVGVTASRPNLFS